MEDAVFAKHAIDGFPNVQFQKGIKDSIKKLLEKDKSRDEKIGNAVSDSKHEKGKDFRSVAGPVGPRLGGLGKPLGSFVAAFLTQKQIVQGNLGREMAGFDGLRTK